MKQHDDTNKQTQPAGRPSAATDTQIQSPSVCLICMKYRIFLIIFIINLAQILLSYIASTSRTHARTHACTHARTDGRTHTRSHAPARTRAHTHPHTHTPPSPYRYSMSLCQPTVTARSAGDNSWSLAIEINTGTGGPVSPEVLSVFRT